MCILLRHELNLNYCSYFSSFGNIGRSYLPHLLPYLRIGI
nr:MAG TPA: hypothetical protein [Caudoviricetes sp.]